jgi:sugar diacid utilization regulator
VNCARVEKRRTADLATEQQTASRPEQDLTAEVKIKQLPVHSAGRGREPAGQCLRPDWALADLAFDEESHARSRDTLQVFPRAGRYTVTAERLSLHRNGVQYRIRKPKSRLVDASTIAALTLELALRACQYLGHACTSAIGLRIGSGGLSTR